MFINNINPVLVSIFGLEVRYYGIVYVIGFLLILYILNNQRNKLNLSKDDVYDYVFYLIIFTVVGARLFEILFYEPLFYFSNPLEILMVWHGGLSFHGALTGVMT
ncbi:MAG: prolipoprotein diacylglyceryl transferase family protein, partial [Nanoarchaeota archaeon]